MISREAARRHLEALAAEPRPAGSEAERRARAYCARVLTDAGFAIAEEPFEFSAFPGLYATPVFGVFAVLALLAAASLAARGAALGALVMLLVAASLMALGGAWLARQGVVRLRVLRRRSTNLVARRGEPRVWLVAHLDSKSQPVPMLLRAGGITLLGAVWLVAIALATVQALVGPGAESLSLAASVAEAGRGWWRWIAMAGIMAGAPIAASFVGERSPGAVDDASGVATVLLAARSAAALPIGVLLTSAEELGLAGARAWGRANRRGIAINCDGVDDAGALTAMYSGARPERLLALFATAAAGEGVEARGHRVLPGVLVDGVALADAGWEVITISRGSMQTLRRIHTPGDDLNALTGDGVVEAARVMSRMAHALGAAE